MQEFSTYFKVKTDEQDPQNLLQVVRGVLMKSRVSMNEMTIAVPADYFQRSFTVSEINETSRPQNLGNAGQLIQQADRIVVNAEEQDN